MPKPVLILQNCPDESPGTITEYLETQKLPFRIVKTFDNQILPDPDTIESVINLGCPCSVREYHRHDYLKRLYAFTAEMVRTDRPYLGVCFGGQLLARILGAEVTINPAKEIGTYSVSLTPSGLSDPAFESFEPEFPVFQWHNDTFKIPFSAQKLATAVDCENQAFRHGRTVGLQFHLEVNRADVDRWCEVYADELLEVGKSKDDILSQYLPLAASIRNLNFKLLDNFLEL